MSPRTAVYSLRRRLLFWLFATITLGVLIQAGVSYRVALDEVDLLSDYHMEHMALAIKGGLPPPVMPDELDTEAADDGFDLSIQAWNEDGERVLGTAATASHVPKHPVLGFSTLQMDGRAERVFVVQHEHGVIQVTNDMSSRNALARRLAWRTSTPVVLMAPLLLIGVWWLVSLSLRPIEEARAQVADRAPSDLSALPKVRLPSELLPFIDEINSLFERIRHHLSSQQQFIADAAHELRSPLAALRLQVQVLQRAQQEDEQHTAHQRLLAGIDRSTWLVEQLLALARQESPAAVPLECVDLSQLMRLAISDVLPLAQARNIDMGAAHISDIHVLGHTEALRMLLRNLLDNAVKYTPVDGTVDVSINQIDGTNVTVQIEDSGSGISVDDMPRVFDRFYRGQAPDTLGSGLGLSIVKAIADHHGMSIQIGRSEKLGGAKFSLSIKPHSPSTPDLV